MKMNKVADLLALHFKTKRPLLLIGPSGVGKTTAVKAFAKAMGVGYYEYRAAYCEPGDLKGLCNPGPNDEMNFLRPNDLPPKDAKDSILFLDEINRASTSVLNCLMQATDGSGRIATHELPEGLLVVAACNPDNANHLVNSMDFALVNRFNVVEIDYDKNVLLKYGKEKAWHPKVLGFIAAESSLFTEQKFDGTHNVVTSRSLEYMSDMEKAGLGEDLELHRITSQGLLGQKLGLQYHAYATGEQPVTVEELRSDKDAMKRIKKFSDPKAIRSDLISVTNGGLVDWFKDNAAEKFDKKTQKTIVSYLSTIPADSAVGVLKSIFMFRPELVDTFQNESELMDRFGDRLSA